MFFSVSCVWVWPSPKDSCAYVWKRLLHMCVCVYLKCVCVCECDSGPCKNIVVLVRDCRTCLCVSVPVPVPVFMSAQRRSALALCRSTPLGLPLRTRQENSQMVVHFFTTCTDTIFLLETCGNLLSAHLCHQVFSRAFFFPFLVLIFARVADV